MIDQDRYFSLLASVGITLHAPNGNVLMASPSGADRRQILAEASRKRLDERHIEGTREGLIAEIADELRLIRREKPSIYEKPNSLPVRELDWSHARERLGRIQVGDPKFDWHTAIEYLDNHGIALRPFSLPQGERGDTNTEVGFPFLFEAYRKSDGYVISGGKGQSSEDAQMGAIAEAIERTVAACPTLKIFATDSDDLRRTGFTIPYFDVGPRDAYSASLVLDWVAAHTLAGQPAALPAERALYNYNPKSGIRAFAWQHTAGLAAGNSIQEALWAAVSEVIERDAYWLTMRCKLVAPTVRVDVAFQRAPFLEEIFDRTGLRVILKDISLDWPLRVVHALIFDESGRVPAFSHGTGSAPDTAVAAVKAILEAFQIRAGLIRRCVATNDEAILGGAFRPTGLIWSDPNSRWLVDHLLVAEVQTDYNSAAPCQPAELLREVERIGGPIVWTELGQIAGLVVARAYLENALLPQPELEHIPTRLKKWLTRSGLRYPYLDPILS